MVGFQQGSGFCCRNTKSLYKSHRIQRWGLAVSPVNSLGWPTPLLSVLCSEPPGPVGARAALTPAFFPPLLLLLASTWRPHHSAVRSGPFFPSLVFGSPRVLTVHVVEGHIHFYPRKTHCRGGTGVISRKTVTHPSLPEMKEVHLWAHCSSLLYGVL